MNRNAPPRDVVLHIAKLEAARAGITLDQILGDGSRQAARFVDARREAIRRIVSVTGCSATATARVWGLGREAASKAFRTTAGRYDPETVDRLSWAHGAHRAAQIVAGNDPKTQADLAAWRRLGSGRPA